MRFGILAGLLLIFGLIGTTLLILSAASFAVYFDADAGLNAMFGAMPAFVYLGLSAVSYVVALLAFLVNAVIERSEHLIIPSR